VCGACGELRGQTRLCGHVGERVGGAVGQDVRLGHFQDRDAGRELVQAAPDDRLLHGKDAPAEPLVVAASLREFRPSDSRLTALASRLLASLASRDPVAPLEGPVDEESQEPGRVLLRGFIGVHG